QALTRSPARSPSFTSGTVVTLLSTVTVLFHGTARSARVAVIIFVSDAILRRSCARFVQSTRPEWASTRIASGALTLTCRPSRSGAPARRRAGGFAGWCSAVWVSVTGRLAGRCEAAAWWWCDVTECRPNQTPAPTASSTTRSSRAILPPRYRRLRRRRATGVRTSRDTDRSSPGDRRASVSPAPTMAAVRTTAELREGFQAFFEERGHLRRPSASLIPRADDRSTLYTSAGMQPQMPYFLGLQPPAAPLTTTCQKCFRTPDIDE